MRFSNQSNSITVKLQDFPDELRLSTNDSGKFVDDNGGDAHQHCYGAKYPKGIFGNELAALDRQQALALESGGIVFFVMMMVMMMLMF